MSVDTLRCAHVEMAPLHAECTLPSIDARFRPRLEVMGAVAGGVAHDFNNILAAIIGFAEMALQSAPAGSRLQHDIESIMAAGQRGCALVDRIRRFSSGEADRSSAVPVEDLVREALDLTAAKLPPGVTIEARLHAPGATVLGDSTQLHRVLMNLASNAIQAMPSAGVLGVSAEAVRVQAPRPATSGALVPGDYVKVTIADTGVGMTHTDMQRIFDPFFTTREGGGGTGLGLWLVNAIVCSFGGAIDVASEIGIGTAFTVYLPREAEHAPA